MNDCDQCQRLLERTESLVHVMLERHWQEIFASAKELGETTATLKLTINPAANRFDVGIEYTRPVRDVKSAAIDDGQRDLPGID